MTDGARGLSRQAKAPAQLRLVQPRDGYRYSIDALLLAGFARRNIVRPPRRLIDLGAGCGVVGLWLARGWPETSLDLVELQPELAELAVRNAAHSGLEARTRVVVADLRRWQRWAPPPATPGRQVLAVCNPPYYPAGSGRLNRAPGAALARHELAGTLRELLRACGEGLPSGATLAIVHLAARCDELLRTLSSCGFTPLRLRRVVPRPGAPAHRVLVAAVRAGPHAGERVAGPSEDEPLLVHLAPGRYSEEVAVLLDAIVGEPPPAAG